MTVPRAIVVCAVLAGLFGVLWFLLRDGGSGAAPTTRQGSMVSASPGEGAEFGDRVRAIAERHGAARDAVQADASIEKVDGEFVRHWTVEMSDPESAVRLADGLEAEARRWDGTTRRDVSGHDGIAMRIDLGVEVFDVNILLPGTEVVAAREPTPTPEPRRRPAPGSRGRLAVILDDAGNSLEQLDAVAALPAPVAVAVLPHLPHSSRWAARMHDAGHEVLLHLPMEPEDPSGRPGPGAVRVAMHENEIRMAVRSALNSVPHVVGVNNHMGSKATADLRTMTWVLQELSVRGLFFVDSRTTVATVAEDAARAQGVPTARRHVFLDNDQRPAAIKRQLEEAVELARLDGWALAIGHVRASTVTVLAETWPMLRHLGADPVAPSEVVR